MRIITIIFLIIMIFCNIGVIASKMNEKSGVQPETVSEAVSETVNDNENGALPDEELFYLKVSELKKLYPDGMYWNYGGVTDIPCNHEGNGYGSCNRYTGVTDTVFYDVDEGMQCLGFVSMLSDYIFGDDAGIRVFYDFDSVRPGDHIRLDYLEHSLFVLEKGEDYVIVAECNRTYNECMIEWGRIVTREEIEASGAWYITRYDIATEICCLRGANPAQ